MPEMPAMKTYVCLATHPGMEPSSGFHQHRVEVGSQHEADLLAETRRYGHKGAEDPGSGSQACESSGGPLSDERLAAIERFWSQRLNRDNSVVNKACDDVPELTTEIRRLRRENRLLHLSAGSAPDGRGVD